MNFYNGINEDFVVLNCFTFPQTYLSNTGKSRDSGGLILCAQPGCTKETLKYGIGKREIEERKNRKTNQHLYLYKS